MRRILVVGAAAELSKAAVVPGEDRIHRNDGSSLIGAHLTVRESCSPADHVVSYRITSKVVP